MRTDILDLKEFYRSPLGAAARGFIGARIEEAWRDHAGLRIAGFGHAEPYLAAFDGAERALALAPGGQGVVQWPESKANRAALVGETRWPLPDASIDRLLIIHGLEESADPTRLMREVWRVLTSDGRAIFVVANRRGLWSAVDTTPFAHGRPYLKRQLERLLQQSLFRPLAWSSALQFPPVGASYMLRAAKTWEGVGARLWPAFSGVLLVEAAKDMERPVGLAVRQRARIGVGVTARPAAASALNANRECDGE